MDCLHKTLVPPSVSLRHSGIDTMRLLGELGAARANHGVQADKDMAQACPGGGPGRRCEIRLRTLTQVSPVLTGVHASIKSHEQNMRMK